MSDKSDRILSVGCGTGFCEEILIANGFNVDLQECQENSVEYIKQKQVDVGKIYITTNFDDIPSDTYDVVLMNHISYCFDDYEYETLLRHLKRILKVNGKLIMTCENLSYLAFIKQLLASNKAIRTLFRRNPIRGVFWGYLRTPVRHKKFFKSLFHIKEFGVIENIPSMFYFIASCSENIKEQ